MKIRQTSRSELVELLAAHRVFRDVPVAELEWIAERGELRELEIGELTSAPSLGVMTEMFIVITGRIVIYFDRGGVRKVLTWLGGDVTGVLPYSRLTTAPGEARVESPTELVAVHKDHFPELIQVCPEATKRLVWEMLDRTRHFTKFDLQDENLKSLGRLSAGIAHEMDNPAAAVIRGAKLLVPLLDEADAAARALGDAGITPEQYAAVEELRNGCLTTPVNHVRSALEQARHEEVIVEWIEDRDLGDLDIEALAEAPVTVDMLDRLEQSVDPKILEKALRWVASGCAIRSLAAEMGEAANRISHLVKAVKGFTQMDTPGAPRPVDVTAGLSQTLAIIRSKAKTKSVRIAIQADPDLPYARAVAGELNQVWLNLIDNAIDAVAEGGSVDVAVAREGGSIVVRVIDDGPGVPAENVDRIFEPFFSTKGVKGTGLGLDIVRRLVDSNDGELDFTSAPGRTEFRVRLPVVERNPDTENSR